MITTIFIIAATICWVLAAFNVPTGRVSMGWLGLVFFGLSLLIK